LASEYARQGKDWETELRQRAKEKQLMNELGLSEAEAQPPEAPEAPQPSQPHEEDDADAEDSPSERQAA